MSENDQYPQHRRDSKKPVTLLLLALLVAGIAAFFYETMDAPHPPQPAPAGSSGTPSSGAANPNALVPPRSGSQSPTPP